MPFSPYLHYKSLRTWSVNPVISIQDFQPDPAQFFSIVIRTLIENRSQMDQTLIENFQPDPD